MIQYDITQHSEDNEEILFCGFFSDTDPSLLLMLSYSHAKQCSYLKVMKIFNFKEQEEDWSNISSNAKQLLVEKTYSMVEDEAKEAIIKNLRENLQNEPVIEESHSREMFKNDNIQVKIDDASQSKVKII